MATIEEIKFYYTELLLYQYINQTKARETISLLTGQAYVDLLPISILDGFNIETAIGPQLDILGEYIGLSRAVKIEIARDYLEAEDQTNPTTPTAGLTTYLNETLNKEYSIYNSTDSDNRDFTNLTDDEYRVLLKLKALMNQSNGSLKSIIELLWEIFGWDVYISELETPMYIVYYASNKYIRIINIANEIGLLPKPMGVEIDTVLSSDLYTTIMRFDDPYSSLISSTGFGTTETGYSSYRLYDAVVGY